MLPYEGERCLPRFRVCVLAFCTGTAYTNFGLEQGVGFLLQLKWVSKIQPNSGVVQKKGLEKSAALPTF